MKFVIAGSRSFNDYYLMDSVLQRYPIEEVISGTAAGADTLGELWAQNNGIPVRRMPANWNTYGAKAGSLRNEDMLEEADKVVLFWDSNSPGTRHMLERSRQENKLEEVVLYNPGQVNAIFAVDRTNGFGMENRLPWPKIKEDMEVFKRATHNCPIIMGRSTADSMPLPLPYRFGIVVTNRGEYPHCATINPNLDIVDSVIQAQEDGLLATPAWLIGGKSILTLDNLKKCDSIILTRVKGEFECDTFIDEDITNWIESHEFNVIEETNKIVTMRYQIAQL